MSDELESIHITGCNPKTGEIYLFGNEETQVSNNEMESFEPGVDYIMSNRFIRNLNYLKHSWSNNVVIHMKTCGGDFTEGMAIYDAIKSYPEEVKIISYTHARSMSSIILQAADKRILMPNSYFMFHQGDGFVEGTFKQVRSAVKFDERLDQAMLPIYVNKMKEKGLLSHLSKKEIKAWLIDQMDKKEDVFLTAQEAIDYGLADEVYNG